MAGNDQREIFRQWLSEHAGLVARVCRAYAESREDREDLFQEAVLAIWQSIPSFDGRAKASTWIYKVSLYTALARRRNERKHRRFHLALESQAEIADGTAAAGKVLEDRETLDSVYKAFHELPAVDRSLALLHLDGLTHGEIADILGISTNHVGVKINRAKKQLAQQLKGLIDDI